MTLLPGNLRHCVYCSGVLVRKTARYLLFTIQSTELSNCFSVRLNKRSCLTIVLRYCEKLDLQIDLYLQDDSLRLLSSSVIRDTFQDTVVC